MRRKLTTISLYVNDRLWLCCGLFFSPVVLSLGRQRLHSVQFHVSVIVCTTIKTTSTVGSNYLGTALAFVCHHPVQKNDDKDSEHDHVTHVLPRRRV